MNELVALCFVIALNFHLGQSQKDGDICVIQYNNASGLCTPVSRCLSAREDFQKKGIRPTVCSFSNNEVFICCNDGNSTIKIAHLNESKPVWRQLSDNSNGKKRVSERKCDEFSRVVVNSINYIPLVPIIPDPYEVFLPKPNCSYLGSNYLESVTPGEFPHMAAIGWIDFEGNYTFHCGGSLISSRFVLTAGHCSRSPKMRNPNPSIVRLGDINLNPNVNDGASPIDVPIKKIHKHPLYRSPRKYNDIALFELPITIIFTLAIRPACLWTKPDIQGYKEALAIGWGAFSASNKRLNSDELLKASLPILENDYCNSLLNDTFNRHWYGFDDSQLCAGDLRGRKDTCQGDSGSPLQVVSDDNTCIFYIVGITSFGRGCAEAGRPAVYTRVSSYIEWIESVVWPDELV